MLFAQLFDAHGNAGEQVTADSHDKAFYHEMSVRGRLRCTACEAPAIHVSACTSDGNSVERVAHFRAEHEAGCLLADDPRDPQKTETFKKALSLGLPILINLNFDVGFKKSSLSLKFNPLVNCVETGLWSKMEWQKWAKSAYGGKHLPVPAHDITDILYYLELAKEHGQGDPKAEQVALSHLWFQTDGIVQSCKRFIVKDNARASERLLQQLIDRALTTRTQSKELRETPRLFLFHTTRAQLEQSLKKAEYTLYGQALDVDVHAASKSAPHVLKLGMRFAEKSGLNNQVVVGAEGADMWVVAVPTLTRRRAFEIVAKVRGDVTRHIHPAFCYLRVGQRSQFVRPGTPRRVNSGGLHAV